MPSGMRVSAQRPGLGIAFALAVSLVVFRHVPDGWAWIGMVVIAACGAVSAWLNATGTRQKPGSIVAADTAYDWQCPSTSKSTPTTRNFVC